MILHNIFIIGLDHIVIYVDTKKYWFNWWALTKPQLIIGQSNMIIGELNPLSFHTFLLFKYPIRVKLTQNILREILDISLDYWWLRYKCLSDMGGFSLGWNLTKSAFGLSIEFRTPDCQEQFPATSCIGLKIRINTNTLHDTHLRAITIQFSIWQ